MSAEEDKALHRRFFEEVVVGGNTGLIDELFSPDYVGHPTGSPEVGLEGFKAGFEVFGSTFSDTDVTIEHQVADDGFVATHVTMAQTHTGPVMGMPATGKRVTYQAIEIVRIVDGKIVEFWGLLDMLSLVQQLGDGPPPPS